MGTGKQRWRSEKQMSLVEAAWPRDSQCPGESREQWAKQEIMVQGNEKSHLRGFFLELFLNFLIQIDTVLTHPSTTVIINFYFSYAFDYYTHSWTWIYKSL